MSSLSMMASTVRREAGLGAVPRTLLATTDSVTERVSGGSQEVVATRGAKSSRMLVEPPSLLKSISSLA